MLEQGILFTHDPYSVQHIRSVLRSIFSPSSCALSASKELPSSGLKITAAQDIAFVYSIISFMCSSKTNGNNFHCRLQSLLIRCSIAKNIQRTFLGDEIFSSFQPNSAQSRSLRTICLSVSSYYLPLSKLQWRKADENCSDFFFFPVSQIHP